MVMPRSRSMSIESRYCAFMLRGSAAPQISSTRSASVDLPLSTWATMATARMRSSSLVTGIEIDQSDERLARGVTLQVFGHALGQQRQPHLQGVRSVRGNDAVGQIP